MKKIVYLALTIVLLASCTKRVLRSNAYKGMYHEKPLTILLMPPINRSTNVEAKEFFHSTLLVPLAERGYYVIPPFLSIEILKRESAYDAEQFLDVPLQKFGEVFGADIALFTIIHKWKKSAIGSKVMVTVEYIIKSTKTNEVLYARKGEIIYDTSVDTNAPGIAGLIANVALSAINTAATKYVDVARKCNQYTFEDLPQGKYGPQNMIDSTEYAGKKEFTVKLNSSYH